MFNACQCKATGNYCERGLRVVFPLPVSPRMIIVSFCRTACLRLSFPARWLICIGVQAVHSKNVPFQIGSWCLCSRSDALLDLTCPFLGLADMEMNARLSTLRLFELEGEFSESPASSSSSSSSFMNTVLCLPLVRARGGRYLW